MGGSVVRGEVVISEEEEDICREEGSTVAATGDEHVEVVSTLTER